MKTKLPRKYLTLKHKCSQCSATIAKRYSFRREVRWLCPVCLNKNRMRDIKETPHFVRASKLKGDRV